MRRLALCGVILMTSVAGAQDMRLSQVLVNGETWKEVKLPEGKPVALAGDARGKLYLALTEGNGAGVFTLEEGDKLSRFNTATTSFSALGFDDKGTLHAVATDQGLVTVDAKRALTLLVATSKQLGAIAVAPGGAVYYIDVANKAIMLHGRKEPVAEEIGDPAGLAFSKDGSTLIVGDAAGKHLHTFRVAKDGTLDAKEAYYTLRTRPKQPSEVRSLAVDDAGRLYAATNLGVQVFDPTGRMSGVLSSPLREPVTALAFAGSGRSQLFILCGGKLWQRKTKAKAAWPSDAKDR